MPIADAFSLFVRSLRAERWARPALLQIRGGAARELEGAGVNRHRIRVVTVAGLPVDLRGLGWTVDEEQRGLDVTGGRSREDDQRAVDVRVDADDAPCVKSHRCARSLEV